jgi:hypothetical protein
MADDGTGYAVWAQEIDNSGIAVMARRFVDGVAQAPQQVSKHGDNRVAFTPQVAQVANGEAVAVWVEQDVTGGDPIVMGARTVNQQWQDPVQLQEHPRNGEVAQLDIVGNEQDFALAVWSRHVDDTVNSKVFGVGFNGAAGFGATQSVSGNSTSAEFPSAAIDAEGRGLVAWQRRIVSTGNEGILVRNFNVSTGQMVAAERINEAFDLDAGKPRVAIGPNATATVVWEQAVDGTPGKVAFATSSNFVLGGANWRAAQVLPSVGRIETPLVALDPQGNSTVVWKEVGANNVISLMASRIVQSPVAGQLLELDDTGNVVEFRLAVDAAGSVLAFWTQDVNAGTGIAFRPFANRFNPLSGNWGQAQRLDTGVNVGPGTTFDVGPSLALNAGGEGLLLWTRDAPGSVSVFGTTLR